jgi:hypothetical protein
MRRSASLAHRHGHCTRKHQVRSGNAYSPGRAHFGGLTNQDGAETVELETTYGNPYPQEWAEIFTASAAFRYSFTVTGDPRVHFVNGFMNTDLPVAGATSMTLEPMITPPANVRINGMASTTELSGVGTSPQLQWDAPSMGSAAFYRITLFEVLPALASAVPAGILITDATHFTIPPGFLKTGSYYVAQIRAHSAGDIGVPYQNMYGPKADALASPFKP